MEDYKIDESVVTTNTEALYWIAKIWFENSHHTKDEKEQLTKNVLDFLTSNIIDQIT